MDWLVVILVVIALAMVGIVSLLHRGRVRLWSIAMILLGLGISIFLYTQIHIFQNWQSILYIVCSVALLLVLVYLAIVLRMRRLSAKDKQPEENDVLATASREPMRVSDWEAVIAYSAAPAKQKGIRRVAGKKAEVSASVPLASAAFTPAESPEQEQNEQKAMAADAITSFFRENTKLPQSSAKSAFPFENEKAAERRSFPEPLRVKSSAKPAVDPAPVDDDSEFESLSFRVVRDKSAKTAVSAPVADPTPEHTVQAPKASVSAITTPAADAMAEHAAQAPKTAVTKEARTSLDAEAPLYKVHKAALSASDGQAVPAPEGIAEMGDALVSGSTADLASDVSFSETVQPANDVSAPYEEELPPASEDKLLVESGIEEISLPSFDEKPAIEAAEETFCVSEEAPRSSLEEAPFLPVLESEPASIDGMLKPSATQSSPAAEDAAPFAQDDAAYAHLQPAVDIAPVDEPAVMPMSESAATVAAIVLEENEAVEPEAAAAAVMDISVAEDDFEEPASSEEAPATEELIAEAEEALEETSLSEAPAMELEEAIAETKNVPEELLPVPTEDPLQSAFAQGMAELNALVASRAYRSAQTLIFDLLRMAYTPTEEEKKKLLLIMKLLKEKETRTDADARTR